MHIVAGAVGHHDSAPGGIAAAQSAILMAHGAGNDMHESLLAFLAQGLAARDHWVLRFNFPYRSEGRPRPDGQRVLERTWLSAAAWAANKTGWSAERLMAGGKSMGARVVSQLAGAGKLQAAGFLFWGYPLHAPGKKQQLRDAHLEAITAPMLFVAGTRDPFCDLALIQPVVDRLKDRASLEIIADGDHSFRVPRASEKQQEAVYTDILERSLNWLKQVPAAH